VIRRLAPIAVLVALVAALPATASAAQDPLERGRAENEIARTLVDRSLAAAKAGDYKRAHDLARTAYLDHYEYVEIPLRLRDPNLVLDTEFKFAALREDLSNKAPLDEIRDDVRQVRGGITETDRVLAEKGVAAPLVAFGFSFSILFREGVEAVLLIAILLGSLAAGQASGYRRPLALGVLGALGATALTAVVAIVIVDLAPVNRELLEAITALLAVGVLILVSFWLISRLEHKRRMEFMRARVAGAIAAGSAGAFMACVVEKATSSTRRASSPSWPSRCESTHATPAVTPSAEACVVGTTEWARRRSGLVSTATALVKVPPTSTPTRSLMPPPPACARGGGGAPGPGRTPSPRRWRRRPGAPPASRRPRRSGGCR
jgi:hypothetical protein